jgi:hypothetical protein
LAEPQQAELIEIVTKSDSEKHEDEESDEREALMSAEQPMEVESVDAYEGAPAAAAAAAAAAAPPRLLLSLLTVDA